MPLKVIVIGAGLGGLGAAIAFTRAGHHVEVFEKSSFGNEVGAAIHLAPNATRVLRAWELDLDAMSPSKCTQINAWTKLGASREILAMAEKLKTTMGIRDEWFLVHRVDLHSSLLRQAIGGANGRRAKLQLSCPVIDVDAERGRVRLEDGREYQADLIIGADGLHSKTVCTIDPGSSIKLSTGQICYRFLIPTEKSTNVFSSDRCRLIMYPCRSGRLLNFGAFVPERQRQVGESSWLDSGSHTDLMNEFQDFCPEIREICRIAEDLKVWSLETRNPPMRFYQGKLALIGDAAHPTMPHQGQGGAQAFEDAAALGALFTADTTTGQIDQKLRMYNSIRYKHAVTMMFMSRVPDDRRSEVLKDLKTFVPDAVVPDDMWEYAWTSYPIRAAEEALDYLNCA